MAQRNPSQQDPPRKRGGKASDTAGERPPQDIDKEDVHRAPESGEKPEASGGGSDQPPREPDEV